MLIKVRVWNGEQFISPDFIDRNGIAYWKENSIPESSSETELFTGLHDKNGKEIYEGDVVKISFGKHWWVWKVSVLDNNRSNTLYLVGIKDNLTRSEDGETYTYKEQPLIGRDEIEFKQPKNIEIIGNIHDSEDSK